MKGKQDGVAKLAVPAQPQSVVQTLHRVRLADIDVVVLRRSDRRCIPAVFHQRRKCKRLIAMLFVNAEEVDWRGEQMIDRDLNIDAHMARKFPGPRRKLAVRNSSEVPIEGRADIGEFLYRHFLGRLPDRKHAFAAKVGCPARELDFRPWGRHAAQIARAGKSDGFGGDQQTMPGSADMLLRGLEQGLRDGGRVGAATDFVLLFEERRERNRFSLRLAEHGAQELTDKLQRGIIIVMKENLDNIAFGENVWHETPLERTTGTGKNISRTSRKVVRVKRPLSYG
jgi:hypothetical protein